MPERSASLVEATPIPSFVSASFSLTLEPAIVNFGKWRATSWGGAVKLRRLRLVAGRRRF